MAHTKLEIAGGVARLHVDDGKVNALSAALIGEIAAALDEAEASAASALVLRGREGVFSAGFDLKTFQRGAEAGTAMVLAGARLVERLLSFPLPVLGVCTGHAYPAGAFLLMASDVRVGVSGPFQLGMNEVAIGLTIPKFAIELARHRLTPPGFAALTTATMFGPEEARRRGYLDRVVAPAELDSAIEGELERLLALDRQAYVGTKARVNEAVLAAVRAAIEDESPR